MREVIVCDRTAPDLIKESSKGAEILFANKTILSAVILSKLPALKYGVLVTRYDIVDVKYTEEHGITVTNIPTCGTYSVSQFVLALLLEICHHCTIT